MKISDKTTPCNEIIKSLIDFDSSTNVYHIPKDLNLENFPQDVIDGFLDLMNRVADTELRKSTFLRLIKEGEMTISCKEE